MSRMVAAVVLVLSLALCRTIYAQVENPFTNQFESAESCLCTFKPGNAGESISNCNSSRNCYWDPSKYPFLACVNQYVTRRTGDGVDQYARCVQDGLELGMFCGRPGNLNVEGFEDYYIEVVNRERLDFTICCYDTNCNTEEAVERVRAYLTRPVETTPNPTSLPSDGTPPPLYAVIAIPVLSVTVVIVVIIIIVVLCVHFQVLPRNGTSTGAPTITSRDSSSYEEQSLNDLLDNSGSGSGQPLLTMQSIAGQISLHELIGKGRYGEVWKGKYKCDEVAVKIFHTREEASWAHEVDIYKTCLFRHPNILRFIASDNKDVGMQVQLWLITEFCEFGSLYDLLIQRSIEPAVMMQLAYTATCGLDHLHTEIYGHEAKPAIAHRDLKSRNILVKADFTCCIGDLGLALRYDRATDQVEDPPSKRVGTKRYLAPEIIDEAISFKHFDSFKKADIYSFGLILWEITMRGEIDGVAEDYQMPYHNHVPTDPSFEDMKKTVAIDKRRPTIPNKWTQSELFRGMSKLIQQCWLHDSDARLTASRLKKSLHNLQQSCVSEKKKDKEQSA